MKFGRTPHEIERERKRLLIYAFSTLGSVFLFIFGVTAFLDGRIMLAGIVFSFLGAAFFTAVSIKRAANVQLMSFFVASILFVLSSYLLLSGGAEGTGFYWSYPISVLMVLLVGPKAGGVYMGLFISFNSVFIFGPFSFTHDYSSFEAIRIMASLIALYTLTLASEWIRTRSYGAISEASENHRHQANTDALTGLLNRNGVLVSLKDKAIENGAVVTLLDIDNFKKLNDKFGHDLGDAVLRKLSDTLRFHTKGGDLVARWGGEEFLLILFDASLESAESLINKVKNEFGDTAFHQDDASISVTFSAGLAALGESSELESAVTMADKRLYAAKYSGRNKVVAQ